MASSRVRVLRGRGYRVTSVVADTIEEFLCSAARIGLEVPEEVVVEVFEAPGMLEPRLDAEARSVGGAYAGVRPESCVLYAGWTGLPQVFILLPSCSELDEECIQGEAARAAAHSILHRGVEAYIYTVNYCYESMLRLILGQLYPVFLYLVGAGVRGYEANTLACRLGYMQQVFRDELRAVAEAVAALARLRPIHRSRLLVAAEIFKNMAEVEPFNTPGSPIAELLERLTPLYPAEYNAARRAVRDMRERHGTPERARAAAERLIEELLPVA